MNFLIFILDKYRSKIETLISCISMTMYFVVPFVLFVVFEKHLIFLKYLFNNENAYYCGRSGIAELSVYIILFIYAMAISTILLYILFETPTKNITKSRKKHAASFLKKLSIFTALTSPIAIALLVGFSSMTTCYTENSITYRPFPFVEPRKYEPSQLYHVWAGCRLPSRGGWVIELQIRAVDGTNLEASSTDQFEAVPFERIIAMLNRVPFEYIDIDPKCPAELRRRLEKTG